LHARLAADPNTRNLESIEFSLESFKSVKKLTARGQKGVDAAIDDNFCPEQVASSKVNLTLYGMEWNAAWRYVKKRGRFLAALFHAEQIGLGYLLIA